MWIFQNPSRNSRTTGSFMSFYSRTSGRRLALARPHFGPGTQLVGAASRDLVASPQIAKDLDQGSRRESSLDIPPPRLASADPDHKRAIGRGRHTRARYEQRRA